MEDKIGQQDHVWPVPTFKFKVDFGGQFEMVFQEVSGLDTEYDILEYRSANRPEFSVVKMPSQKKFSDITFKKGMTNHEKAAVDYFSQIKMNTVTRKTVTIQLLDEQGKALFTWALKNAFPKKATGMSMNAKTSEVAIEEIMLAHEGIEMSQ